MADKMTNVKALSYVLENCELPDEVKAKIVSIKAQNEKKNSPSKADKEKEALYNETGKAVVECMIEDNAYRIRDMLAEFPCFEDRKIWTSSKATVVVGRLLDNGLVKSFKSKGDTYYALPSYQQK